MVSCLRRALVALIAALLGISLPSGTALAKVFDVGPVDGIVDLTFAYGLMARTQKRDLDFVGIANGGNAPSVNFDDGDLNYDKGVFSNELRLSADLTLAWRNFGAFIRGFGFYDFENELGDRARTELSDATRRLVGAGGKLQEYYLSARFVPGGVPIQIRVGNQVINWGEGSFLRFGVDVVNPIDFVSLLQPTASVRDVFVPQGMVWAASNVTELIAIEGFYQYTWEPVIDAPVGTFFSADDLIGGNGTNKYVTEGGEFSDLGTDLDQEFGLPPGSLGFDENFMRVPSAGRDKPSEQGQFGFTVGVLLPALNSSSLGVHFINYHSRLPLISGIAADEGAIQAASEASGGTLEEKTLALGTLSNETSYLVTYPEDIKMLGLSFDGVLPRVGTLIGLEVSHHFNWPVQVLPDEVIEKALSPIRYALGFLGVQDPLIAPNQVVSGIDETHKTQLAVSFVQAFGPRLWSSNSLMAVDIGWAHFDGLSKESVFDEDSWGYSITGALSYDGLFGGVNLEPFLAFTHDVSGVTPGPGGAFLEDRKSVAVGVSLDYINTITANLSYVSFFDGKPLNAGVDRDFISFNIRYHY